VYIEYEAKEFLSPPGTLDQESIMQTLLLSLDHFSRRESRYMVLQFIESLQQDKLGSEGNHEWMLRVEKLSHGVANDWEEYVSLDTYQW